MSRKKTKKLPLVPQGAKEALLCEFKPKTRNQANYIKTVCKNDITFCVGPAGCGKTAIAVGIAVQALYNNQVQKIVIARPVVEASFKSMGALPGDIREKLNPYVRPLYEELIKYYGKLKLEKLIKEEFVDICPLEMMRGRTFDNAVMILDEAQNALFEQLVMFTTRLGKNSKAIITGDLRQSDLPYQYLGGLDKFLEILVKYQVGGTAIVELDKSDNQRHPTVQNIIGALENYHDERIKTSGN